MSKETIAIVFGGRSSEHEISCLSAGGVLSAIDRNKYEVVLIGITKEGNWVLVPETQQLSIKDVKFVTWIAFFAWVFAVYDFILFGTFEDRDVVWQSLLDQGVLIRQTGPMGWLRVSVGTPEENDRFRAALQQAPGTEQEAQG